MRKVFAGALLLFTVAEWSSSSRGQVDKTQETRDGKKVLAHRQIPYTAQYREEWIRPKTDTASGTFVEIETDAISSNGWLMHSFTSILPSGELSPTTRFVVVEPETQIQYTWLAASPGQKAPVQHRVEVTRPPSRYMETSLGSFPPDTTAWPGEAPLCMEDRPSARMHLASDMENLGFKTIDGIPVIGTRSVTTAPPDEINGIIRPAKAIFETWNDDTPCHSSLMVLYVITKPQLRWTKKLLSVSWEEPSSDLFKPPSDYEIPANDPVEASRPQTN